jgi:hypothetical protein
MCEHLLCLKPYFVEAEGTLDCSLSPQQWVIVSDTCTLLKLFMFAQKTFEGDTYATICMVPYILYKIRSLLQPASLAQDWQGKTRNIISVGNYSSPNDWY